MNIDKISNKIWQLKLEDYINVTNYFITTGDVLVKLDRLEKDIYKLLQDIYDIQGYFKNITKKDKINYLETFIEEGKFYIKAKKSRARRIIMKEEDTHSYNKSNNIKSKTLSKSNNKKSNNRKSKSNNKKSNNKKSNNKKSNNKKSNNKKSKSNNKKSKTLSKSNNKKSKSLSRSKSNKKV